MKNIFLRCILATVALLIVLPLPAHAALYAVGTGAGCTHATVQEALSAAVANGSDSLHLVKLTTGTISVPNGLTVHEPRANIRIYGGYTSCTSAQGSDTRTVLDASGGADGGVLDIRLTSTGVTREVELGRLDIVGGSGALGTEGAGVAVRGDVLLELRGQTRVRGNSALRGGGIFLQGGAAAPRLAITEGSSIQDNVARTDGGGVLCAGFASVALQSGSIEFNTAGRDGGGVWLGNRCSLSAGLLPSVADGLVMIANNRAGTVESGSGGGMFHRADQPLTAGGFDVEFIGRPAVPVLLINNASQNAHGGALHVEGTGAGRQRVRLYNAVFANNTAPLGGAAIYAERAINLELIGERAYCGGLFGFGLCSAITGSDTTPVLIRGYASGSAATRVRIERTRFTALPQASP
jgi:predicted outer membrane repeat protein